ncbi:MAG TPA: hypothetical protein VFV99_23090 [Kofleriaceae bacterium]|nr:hypothetical protein [Kofleriaceae bacterium]
MKRTLLVLALSAACTGDDSGGGVQGTAHVETYELPAALPPKLDILFVIDDSTAMASHQTPLAAMPAQLEQLVSGTYGDAVNYHIGVVTTDAASGGNLRTAAGINGTFIVHENTFTGATTNYQGSFATALGSLFPSSATSTASNQPLATMRAALENTVANAGFLRSEAYLGVVTISATDDTSGGGAAADYAAFLKSSKTDPTSVIVSGVIDASATRLNAFHDEFPNRTAKTSIAGTDYGSALELFGQLYRTVLGYACNKEPADVDPTTPGPQYDCAFVWVDQIDGHTEHRLPPCVGGDTSGCWEIVVADPSICTDPSTKAHLQTRGFTTSPSKYGDPFHPTIRGQCLVN